MNAARFECIVLVAAFVVLFFQRDSSDTIGVQAGNALFAWFLLNLYTLPLAAIYLILLELPVIARRGRVAAIVLSSLLAIAPLYSFDYFAPTALGDAVVLAVAVALGVAVYLPDGTPTEAAIWISLFAFVTPLLVLTVAAATA